MARGNPQNLTPYKKGEERAKINGAKGGKKFKENIEIRKSLKQILVDYLESCDDNGVKHSDKITSALVKQASRGNIKAYEIIRDTIGEKPKNEVEVETVAMPSFSWGENTDGS